MNACHTCPHQVRTTSIAQMAGGDAKALRSRSTKTEVQRNRIIAALRSGPKTTDDLRRLGIYQSSARVWELRQLGYVLATDLFDGYAADGYSHARMARYTLISEPAPLDGEEAACS